LSLLHSLVFRTICRTTHHRLAVDSLRHLRNSEAERWVDLFLAHHAEFLAGAVAPDERFGDFKSHVVHVAENHWGDAPAECRRWYGRLVDALARRHWSEAAFAAGALSHYFSDPFMPLHTAATEADTKVHRPLEWCIGRSYGRLQHIIEYDHGGYPQLESPRADDWIEQMVLIGATLAHAHYDTVLQHFDLSRALLDPLTGMDQECQDRIASCLAHAVVGFARVLERAIDQAQIEAPTIETTLQGFLAAVLSPARTAAHHVADLSERMSLEAFADEAARTGKVLHNLTPSQRTIRRLHCEEVLKRPVLQLDQQPAPLTGALYGTGPAERSHPSRLLCQPAASLATDISPAWRAAQQKLRDRQAPKLHRAA
jgi:hypothetical protein